MTYARGLGDSLTDPLAGGNLPPITSISPTVFPAGPGLQRVTVRSSNLRMGMNVRAVPVSNENALLGGPAGAGDSFRAVSADGMSGWVVLDFHGFPATWRMQVVDPVSYDVSPQFPFSVVAGSVTNPYDPGTLANMLAMGLAAPVVVHPTDIRGDADHHLTVVANLSSLPVLNADGTVSMTYPSTPLPGVYFNQPGGSWSFVPFNQLTAEEMAHAFGDDWHTAATQGNMDPFGLYTDGSVVYYDTAGNPLISPFASDAVHLVSGTGGNIVAPVTSGGSYAGSVNNPVIIAPLPPINIDAAPTHLPTNTAVTPVVASGGNSWQDETATNEPGAIPDLPLPVAVVSPVASAPGISGGMLALSMLAGVALLASRRRAR